MKRILFPLMLIAILAGCAGKPDATPNPVASFEKFVSEHPIVFSASSMTSAYCGNLRVVNTSFDVRVTDSLVSPYIGTIIYTYHNDNGNSLGDETVSLSYAFQGDAWVLKDTEASDSGMLPVIIGGQKFRAMCEIDN